MAAPLFRSTIFHNSRNSGDVLRKIYAQLISASRGPGKRRKSIVYCPVSDNKDIVTSKQWSISAKNLRINWKWQYEVYPL